MVLECKNGGCDISMVHSGIRAARVILVFLTHGQVDEGEDVVFDHDGEAEEDGI